MIEKRMYFFWGQGKMSWLRYMTLYSFKKFNPSWKVELYQCPHSSVTTKTWGEATKQDFHNYTGEDYSSRVEQLGISIKPWDLVHPDGTSWADKMGPQHKSNFFKWQMLSEISGFYSDMDILFVKSIDQYYEKVKRKGTILCFNGKFFSIGFLGSSGNNQFFKDVFLHTFDSLDIQHYSSAGIRSFRSWLNKLVAIKEGLKMSGKYNLWNVIKKYYPGIGRYNNEMSLVYPWNYRNLQNFWGFHHTTVPNICIGIHWYAGAGISQKFNNLLTENNYQDYSNTICHFLKKVLQK